MKTLDALVTEKDFQQTVLEYAELKTERGRLTPEQRAWLSLLEGCAGVEVHVWRPSDWPEIEGTLSVTTDSTDSFDGTDSACRGRLSMGFEPELRGGGVLNPESTRSQGEPHAHTQRRQVTGRRAE